MHRFVPGRRLFQAGLLGLVFVCQVAGSAIVDNGHLTGNGHLQHIVQGR